MNNRPTSITATPSQFEEGVYKWYDSLAFTYSVSGMENNGTGSEDSMSPMDIKILVPEGYEAILNITLGVDDWGSVRIEEYNPKVDKRRIFELDMSRENDTETGPRGGHGYRELTGSVSLAPGQHTIHIEHENVTYDPKGEYDPRYNDAKCAFSLQAIKTPIKKPTRIDVDFNTRRDDKPVDHAEKKGAYCASGYVFEGIATVHYAGTNETRAFPVQTGGWMSSSSPFYKEGKRPDAGNADNWDYDPIKYPDTAFPQFVGDANISTMRGGNSVDGFLITGYPASTGRSDLYLHVKERYGSEGCISTGTPDWEVFCAEMAAAKSSEPRKTATIPISVVYTASNSPVPDRYDA